DVADDHRVEGAVVLLAASQIEVEQLEAADLLSADVSGELLGGAEGDVEYGRPPARSSSLRGAIEGYCVSYVPPCARQAVAGLGAGPPARRGAILNAARFSTMRGHP